MSSATEVMEETKDSLSETKPKEIKPCPIAQKVIENFVNLRFGERCIPKYVFGEVYRVNIYSNNEISRSYMLKVTRNINEETYDVVDLTIRRR
ncbi:MAG: hypothetical protein HC836_50370 [Richelia sp. RM2_1_2]|nr:hypothetical protein [Richelia sp. RM2_1_2]